MIRLFGRLDALLDAEGSIRALCLLRVLMGPVVLLHLSPFLETMAEGRWYGEFFYDPWVSWYPEASQQVWYAVLVACSVSAVLMSLGLFSRAATITTFALVAYNFFLSETHFRHNRQFLLVFLMALSLVDAGRLYSIDAWRRHRRGEAPSPIAPLWPLFLVRVLGAAPYFGSGFSKLIDPDWFSGLVTWDRVVRYRGYVEASPAPRWVVELVTMRELHLVFGKIAIFTELFIALGLWSRRTRYAAIWIAICFHATIEVTARVQAFSWLAIFGLLIWAVPSERDRVLTVRTDRRLGRFVGGLVRRLDWLARFRLEETRGEGPSVTVVDRDGRRMEGGYAARFALSRMPLLAWPLLPTLLFGRPRRIAARAGSARFV